LSATEPQPMLISITEISDYLRCRRMWDLGSPNRQALSRKGTPSPSLHLGTGVHHGLAAHAFGQDPLIAIEEWYEKELKRIGQEYAEAVGAPMSPSEVGKLLEAKALAKGMTKHYFEHYGPNPVAPLRIIATEMSFKIPTGLKTKDGREIFLVGTIDGLAVDADGNIYVIDHKTYSIKPDLKWMQTDHQFAGYSWAMQVILKQKVTGFLYDGINKKLPKQPKKLQNGHLSREWNDHTTFASYRAALIEHYGSREDVPTGMYDDFMGRLKERDAQLQTPFFSRHTVKYTQAQLSEWSRHTMLLLKEIADGPAIVPNFPWTGCWDCYDVSDLCKAIEIGDQERFESIKESAYQVGWSSTRSQYKEMLEITPGSVGSLDELLKLMPASKISEQSNI